VKSADDPYRRHLGSPEGPRLATLEQDAMGLTPIYWVRQADTIAQSHRISDLVDLPGIGRSPDPVTIANTLANSPKNSTRSLYANVHRVPAGHRVEVHRAGAMVTRTWPPDLRCAVGPDTFEDAVVLARDALYAAVERALPPTGNVACQVSGGLDSSLIYAMAKQVAARRPGLRIVPVAHLHPGRARCDETTFIDAMTADVPDRIMLPSGPIDPQWFHDDARACMQLPGAPTDQGAAPIRAELQRRSITIVLTGHGGDHAFGGMAFGPAEHLLRREPAAMWRAYEPATTRQRLSKIVRRDIPKAREAVRPSRYADVSPSTFLSPSLARLVEADERAPTDTPPGFRLRWPYIENARAFYFDSRAARAVTTGFDERHPFFDATFVETIAAIPQWFVGEPFDIRRLHRSLAGDLLPEIVRFRKDKAEFGELSYDTLATSSFIANPHDSEAARRGFIDANKIAAIWRLGDEKPHSVDNYLSSIWHAFRVNAWASEVLAQS
jgi:asparagine synthase (glutamine-hydrolysing)